MVEPSAIRRRGGSAIIAHPGRRKLEPQEFTFSTPDLRDLVRAEVLLDGIEVYYPTHPSELVETYLTRARQHDLVISAGSDSHGAPFRMPIQYRAELCRYLLECGDIQVQ